MAGIVLFSLNNCMLTTVFAPLCLKNGHGMPVGEEGGGTMSHVKFEKCQCHMSFISGIRTYVTEKYVCINSPILTIIIVVNNKHNQ